MTDSHRPYTVALTGGVASGKSTVAERFAARGIDVLDADLIARELVQPGAPALHEIRQRFGQEVLDAAGGLDRRRLRETVFSAPAERQALEAILHPRIRRALRERASGIRSPYGLLAIPLLAESNGSYDWIDRVLVVDLPRELQLERLSRRDTLATGLAEAMLTAQAGRAERLRLADDVIDNSGSLAALDAQVERLHHRYLKLAGDRTRD